MAHPGQEIRFGGICLFRCDQRRCKFLLLFLFLLHYIGDIRAGKAYPPKLFIDIEDLESFRSDTAVLVTHLQAEGIGFLLPEHILHVVVIQLFQIFLCGCLIHKAFGGSPDLLLKMQFLPRRPQAAACKGKPPEYVFFDINFHNDIIIQRRNLMKQLFLELLFRYIKCIEKDNDISRLRIQVGAEIGACPK